MTWPVPNALRVRSFSRVLLLGAITPVYLHAQEQPPPAVALQPVTVRAPLASVALTQTTLADAEAEVARTAGAATVVDGEDLRDQRASTIADALGQATGVFAASRFGSQETRLSIRGSGLQRTFHTRGVVLLQDGIPLNLADGSGDFQSIEILAADHIEVYRGADALQYGGASLGGSINFVSPTGRNTRTAVRVEGGSFDYFHAYAQGGGSEGALDGFASGGLYSQGGFRRHAGQTEARFTGNLGYRFSSNLETRFYAALTRSDSQLPGSLTLAQMNADPRQAAKAGVDGDQQRNTQVARFASKTTYRLSPETTVEGGVFYATKTLDHPIFQHLVQINNDYGLTLRVVDTQALAGHDNRWIVGVQPQFDVTHDARFCNPGIFCGVAPTGLGQTHPTDVSRQTSSNAVVYAQDEFGITSRLTLVAGGQYIAAQRKFEDQLSGGVFGANQSFDRTWQGFSPKAGVLYALTPTVQLFGNVSGSFEPPSFGELAGSGGVVNVTAQKAITYELGSRGRLDRVEWDVAIYRAELKDELLGVNTNSSGGTVTVNAPHTVHQGLELGLGYRPLRWLTARVNGLVNDFKLDGDPNFGSNDIPGVPKLFVRSELRADEWGHFAAITVDSAPRKAPIDFANTFFAKGYTTFGLKLGSAAAHGWGWYAEARNLANEKYAATTGVIANAKGVDQAQFFPGDGRSFYAGVEYRP